VDTSNVGLNTLPPVAEETDADDEADDVNNEPVSAEGEQQQDEQPVSEKHPSQPEVETTASRFSQGVALQAYSVENLPYIDPVEYQVMWLC